MTAIGVGAMLAVAGAAPAQDDVDITAGTSDDPGERLLQAAKALEGELGAGTMRPQPRGATIFMMLAQRYEGDEGTHLFVTPTRRSTGVCHARAASARQPALEDAMARCLNGLTRYVKAGGAPAAGKSGTATASAPPPAATPGAPPSPGKHAANWSQVEGVYFRSITTFGVGGMMVMDFEPLVLFKDGSFYEPDTTPIEDLDLAASRAGEPRRWGKWTGGGNSFTLTSYGSRAKPVNHTLQKATFFKAFPAEAVQGRLDAKYTRVSGGGNSALGGTVTVGGQSDTTFAPDGTFGRVGSGGGMSPGVATSSRRTSAGRYRIARHTIEMTSPDGQMQRRFFAVGSKGSPARVDPQIIFIGQSPHTIMDGR